MSEKVVLKSISLEGYRNFNKEVHVPLNRHGITLVKGDNEAGKTTIWDALYWCAYGNNFANLNKEELPTWESKRTESFQGTRVILYLNKGEDSYRIARHIEYKGKTDDYKGGDKLMLFKNGDIISTGVTATQKLIVDLFGMSSKVFMNSIIFGQRMVRLIKAPDSEKRLLFDEIFSVVFIPNAKERGRKKATELSLHISTLNSKLLDYSNEINHLSASYTDKKRVLDNFDIQQKADIKYWDEELTKVDNSIDQHTKVIKDATTNLASMSLPISNEELAKLYSNENILVTDLQNNIRNINRDISNHGIEVSNSRNKIGKLKDALSTMDTTCPTCLQDLPKSKLDEAKLRFKDSIKVEEEVLKALGNNAAYTNQLKGFEDKLDIAQESLANTSTRLTTINTSNNDYNNLKGSINTATTAKKLAIEDRASKVIRRQSILAREKPDYNLTVLVNKLAHLDTESIRVNKELDIKTAEKNKIDWWVSKGFGNSGLKAYVFSAMLNRLNTYIEKYAALLGTRVKFSVDLSKASSPFITEVYREGRLINYNSLSGGAQQRVDISLAFACHDLVSYGTDINILAMDEIFEGLDANGIEQVFELIRAKASDGDSIYIISHQNNISNKEVKTMTVYNDGTNSYID